MNRFILNKLAALPVFAGRALNAARIEPLPGLTNRNYKLALDGEYFVLRLPGHGTERYLDRRREAHNVRIAAALGLAPEIIYFDPADGIQLSRYIDGVAPTHQQLQEPAMLYAVAELLRGLHRSGQQFQGRMALFQQLDDYLGLGARYDDPLAAELRRQRGIAEPLRGLLEETREPLCPCHIDPTPANFLIAPQRSSKTRVYLLDWEYSAMCEPLWDLADLAAEAGFGIEQGQALLHCYYGEVAPELSKRFKLYQALLDLLAAAWAMAQLADSNRNTDFRGYANERLVRASYSLANLANTSRRQMCLATADAAR